MAAVVEGCLHSLSDFVAAVPAQPDAWDYQYEGRCPRTGSLYRLPRTALAKAVAQGLMETLVADPQALGEGKMYGVLLVQVPGQAVVESWAGPHPKSLSPRERDFEEDWFRPPSPPGRGAGGEGQSGGEGQILATVGVLKAFSGLWRGQAQRPGWVPPIPGREQIALLEAQTLDQLHRIKTHLHTLETLPERETYAQLAAEFDQQRQALNQRHRQRREQRAQQRQHLTTTLSGEELATALTALDQASRGDKAERRDFKQRQAAALDTLATTIQAADAEIRQLKRQRRALSQQLQTAMHTVYRLTNVAGDSLTLAEIQALAQPSGLPTGTGDCCTPKLLHYAAQNGWQPLALAEFWWGPPLGDRQSGQFYGACEERCQPILGFLLAGLSPRAVSFSADVSEALSEDLELPILYLDDWLVAVDKPAGLLSVPGRYGDRQDSVLSRLWLTLPEGDNLRPVHRLDQATSGVLLLARTADSHRHLSQQFAQRQVHKVYEALLEGHLIPNPNGETLIPNPTNRRGGVSPPTQGETLILNPTNRRGGVSPPTQIEGHQPRLSITQTSGWIDLPLGPDPQQPPRQRVDWLQGKPSQTYFEVLAQGDGVTRVQFILHTGRTHQLRVHAAHPQGLNAPILGDTLYGHAPRPEDTHQRLCLHAQALTLNHPQTQMRLTLSSQVPF